MLWWPMSELLRDLPVLVLDCQASGATPAHGDLLELGWAWCDPSGAVEAMNSHWLLPRSERRVSRAVRELTGWSEGCLTDAVAATCPAQRRISSGEWPR